jgi:hypothetical protein
MLEFPAWGYTGNTGYELGSTGHQSLFFTKIAEYLQQFAEQFHTAGSDRQWPYQTIIILLPGQNYIVTKP